MTDLTKAIDVAILRAGMSKVDRSPAEDAAAIRRAVLAELERQGWRLMPVEPSDMNAHEACEATWDDMTATLKLGEK